MERKNTIGFVGFHCILSLSVLYKIFTAHAFYASSVEGVQYYATQNDPQVQSWLQNHLCRVIFKVIILLFLTFYSKKMLLGLRASWKYRYMNIYSIDSRLIIVWSLTNNDQLHWNEMNLCGSASTDRSQYRFPAGLAEDILLEENVMTIKWIRWKIVFRRSPSYLALACIIGMDKQKTTRNNQTLNQHR